MSRSKEFLTKLAGLISEYDASIFYTTEYGVYMTVDETTSKKEIFIRLLWEDGKRNAQALLEQANSLGD